NCSSLRLSGGGKKFAQWSYHNPKSSRQRRGHSSAEYTPAEADGRTPQEEITTCIKPQNWIGLFLRQSWGRSRKIPSIKASVAVIEETTRFTFLTYAVLMPDLLMTTTLTKCPANPTTVGSRYGFI